MPSLNLDRIETIAAGLDDLLDEVVFVGGSVVEVYVRDPAAPPIRNTEDVDCIVPAVRYTGLQGWEESLRSKGFQNDIRQGAPICRWIFKEVMIDFMPPEADVLGFSNRWYADGLSHSLRYALPSGRTIRILDLPWFVATKAEATKSRGWPDLRTSHDFEDIIYLWDCVADLTDRLMTAPQHLQSWLAGQIKEWRTTPSFREAVECHAESYKRAQRVLGEIDRFVNSTLS